jgi:hypothetical protein
MKGIALLQGEVIAKEKKYTDFFQKSSSAKPASQSQSNSVQIIILFKLQIILG